MPRFTEEEPEAPRREVAASAFSGAHVRAWELRPAHRGASGAGNHDLLVRIMPDPQELCCVDRSIPSPCLEMLL